jgi:hypothetical protein
MAASEQHTDPSVRPTLFLTVLEVAATRSPWFFEHGLCQEPDTANHNAKLMGSGQRKYIDISETRWLDTGYKYTPMPVVVSALHTRTLPSNNSNHSG